MKVINTFISNVYAPFIYYRFYKLGIGPPPPENTQDVGFCSQLALFIRKDAYDSLEQCDSIINSQEQQLLSSEHHELLSSIDYPFYQDDRSRCEKILDEVKYHITRYKFMEDEYLNYDANRLEIPLSVIAKCCWEITDDETEIERTIKDTYTIENGLIILPSNDIDDDDEHDDVSYTSETLVEPLKYSNQELTAIENDW